MDAKEKDLLKRITINPEIMVGKPTIRNTRITVEYLLKMMGDGLTYEEIKEQIPYIEPKDLQASILYASETLHDLKIYTLPKKAS